MPSIAYAGLSLSFSLHCNAAAEPPVNTVTWRKDGQVILTQQSDRVHVDDDQVLGFREVHFVDEGLYTCTPYNILGTAGESSDLRLVAKQPPSFTQRPPKSYEAEIGSTLKASCIGMGDPPPTVSWRKVGESELSNERVKQADGNITISSITKDDFGLWQCVVSNAVADVTTDVMLYVKYTTPHSVKNVTVAASSTGANLAWIPGYDGGYPQHFMIWYKKASMGDHTWLTVYVDGDRTGAAVTRLDPDTVYQFAILPENVLGSGPFSETETTKTKALPYRPSKSPTSSRVAPPSSLSYTLDDRAMIVLSWQPPLGVAEDAMLGYLVEYRVVEGGLENENEDSNSRKKRDAYSKSSIYFRQKITSVASSEIVEKEEKVQKISNAAPVFKQGSFSFLRSLIDKARTNKLPSKQSESFAKNLLRKRRGIENKTTGRKSTVRVIQSDPGSEDWLASGRWKILAALPSNVTSYRVDNVFRDAKYQFRVLTVSPTAYSAPSAAMTVDTHGMTSYGLMSSSSSSNDISAGAIAGIVLGLLLVAVLLSITAIVCQQNQRRNTELQKTSYLDEADAESFLAIHKSNSDVTKQNSPRHNAESSHLQVSFVKSPAKLEEDSKKPKDGMLRKIKSKLGRNKSFSGENRKSFILVKRTQSLSHGSHESKPVTPIRRSADGKFRIEESYAMTSGNARRSDTMRSNPPTNSSSSMAPRKLRPVSDSFIPREMNRFTRPRIQEIPEEDESDGPALEIDCSRSDIEVRYLPNQSDLTTSSNRTLSPRRSDIGSTSSQIYRPMSANTLPYRNMRATSFCETPPRQRVKNAYPTSIYDPSFRPASASFTNTPPQSVYPPAEYVYLKDLGLPCPETPSEGPGSRCFSPAFPLDPMMSSHNPTPAAPPKDKYHQHSTLPGGHYHLSPRESVAEHPDSHPKSRWREEPFPTSPSPTSSPAKNDNQTPEQKNKLLSPTSSSSSKNTNSNKKRPSNLQTNTAQKRVTRFHSLPDFNSHSCSMPSLSPKRMSEDLKEKRSASEDLLTPCEEDLDRERRCSFTSGSASTVRRLPSRDSNLCSAVESTVSLDKTPPARDCIESTSSDVSASTENQTPRPLEALAETSSGYESQNTSSDISPFAHHALVTDHGHDARYHDTSFFHHVNNPCDHVSGLRASNASSTESSRSRRDNSSVDEKYEWDSESAMESEILEALKHFGNHKRSGPVSQDLLKELLKLGVNPETLSLTNADIELLRLAKDDSTSSSLLQDSNLLQVPTSISKQSIEKRCAALKEEYMEYQRRRNVTSDTENL
uniref:Protein turtle homolog A n=1 Tax=Phallusia mammillata TaxID=59560 RepID=A0A6F9DEE2_9ASCI|nr:protein turtle homolog A [Phallusia mammillata]